MDIQNFLVFCAFVVNFFLSLLIHFRTHKTKANMALATSAFAMTGWSLAMLFYREGMYLSEGVWARLLYGISILIPASLFVFGLHFPMEKKRHSKGHHSASLILIGITTVLASIILFSSSVILGVELVPNQETYIYFGWAFYFLYLPYMLIVYSLAVYIFVRKYTYYRGLHKMQILYILLGTSVTSTIAIFSSVILPALGKFDLNWLGQVFTIFWVSGIAYAVIRHRLMDIRIFVARTIIYTTLVAILGGIYAAGIFFVGLLLVENYSPDTQFVVLLFLTLFIAISFQPLKKFLEHITNDIFFKDRYNANELLVRLGEIATSTLNLSSMTEMLVQELYTQMKATSVSVAIFKNQKIHLQKTAGENTQSAEKTDNHERVFELMKMMVDAEAENILIYDEISEMPKERKLMQQMDAKVFLPLMVKDEAVGVLTLGDKASGEMYTDDDIEMFKILAAQIAVAINNAVSYEEIVHFNETLEQKVGHATVNLQRANERLKELDRVKDEFVSVASHELRTPLTVIRSYLWMILQNKAGKVNNTQKKYLEHAFTTSERLIDLVNDMLNVARIEAGRMNLVKVNNDITQAVRNVILGMSLRAKELSIHLTYEQKKKNIPTLEIDSEKIEQVVINLIGNSLKFTPAGGKIEVVLDYNVSKKEVVVSVSDTGIGISHANLSKLFRKFTSPTDDYRTRNNTQSTGLGLYLSRAIVKMHGGDMWAESDGEGKGATFYFNIPVKQLKTQN